MDENTTGQENRKHKINYLVGYLDALEQILESMDHIRVHYEEVLSQLEESINKFSNSEK